MYCVGQHATSPIESGARFIATVEVRSVQEAGRPGYHYIPDQIYKGFNIRYAIEEKSEYSISISDFIMTI